MKTSILNKVVIVLVLSTIILTGCSGFAGSQPTNTPSVVRVATDATYPPFETVDETTKGLVGFDIDLINAVAEEAGLQIELVNVGFDPLLTGIAQCQYDAAIAAISISDDRAKQMSFSNSYINAGQIVTINKATTDIQGPDDLVGKKIGVQLGTTGAIEAEKIAIAEVQAYDTVDLAFQDLVNKQVDAVVADYPTSLAFVQVNSNDIVTVGDVFTDESYGIAVCKTNTDLLNKINDGLAKVQAKGLIQELEQKWLAGD